MTNLVPRDPFFQDLFDFRLDFDHIFNRILLDKPVWQEKLVSEKGFEFLPVIEAYVDKDAKKYTGRVSLPGVEAKDVEINTMDYMLTIKGERKLTRTNEEFDFYNKEIMYGGFERTLCGPTTQSGNQDRAVGEASRRVNFGRNRWPGRLQFPGHLCVGSQRTSRDAISI